MNLPNRLTIARLILVPVFVVLMSLETVWAWLLAYVVFTAATITDYYDGKIARRRNLITNFGKLWDPLADKVLMASAFIMLMQVPGIEIPGWTIVVILAREFLVTGARSVGASGGKVIAASKSGKIKTVLQMTYIFVFLALAILAHIVSSFAPDAMQYVEPFLAWSSWLGIIAVALYTVYSGIAFARDNWQSLDLSSQT